MLALIAALGNLSILQDLYQKIHIPYEVKRELTGFGQARFGVIEFRAAGFLQVHTRPISIPPILLNMLDKGEASVIQLALLKKVNTVCIDEAAGRRVARLYNLKVTGSLGILLRGKKEGYPISIKQAIYQMKMRDIYLSPELISEVLKLAKEV